MKELQDSDLTGGLFSRRGSTEAIGAAMLRSCVLAASVVLSMAAFAEGADPNGDSDGDGVQNSGDFCPGTPGTSDNYGCPAQEEVVVVYGTRDSYSSVACPDGSNVGVYTDCPGFENWTAYNLAFHDEASGTYSGTTTRVTVEEETDEAEDEELVAVSDVCEDGNVDCRTPGEMAALCLSLPTEAAAMIPECRLLVDVGAIKLEEDLKAFAQSHPRTACVIGVVAGAAGARFFRVRKDGSSRVADDLAKLSDASWVFSTAVGTACALWVIGD